MHFNDFKRLDAFGVIPGIYFVEQRNVVQGLGDCSIPHPFQRQFLSPLRLWIDGLHIAHALDKSISCRRIYLGGPPTSLLQHRVFTSGRTVICWPAVQNVNFLAQQFLSMPSLHHKQWWIRFRVRRREYKQKGKGCYYKLVNRKRSGVSQLLYKDPPPLFLITSINGIISDSSTYCPLFTCKNLQEINLLIKIVIANNITLLGS